jgi:hypothetical protein
MTHLKRDWHNLALAENLAGAVVIYCITRNEMSTKVGDLEERAE